MSDDTIIRLLDEAGIAVDVLFDGPPPTCPCCHGIAAGRPAAA